MLSLSSVRLWFLSILVLAFCPGLVFAGAAEPGKIVPDEGSRNDSPAIAFDRDGRLGTAGGFIARHRKAAG